MIPRPIVWRVARRYIAGLRLDDAARLLADLKRRGLRGTVDYLGEDVHDRAAAEEARRVYCEVLDRLHRDGLPAGVSVKLTQLGLRMDAGFARVNLESLVDHAASRGRFVRVDMEDSSTTDATIDIYRDLASGHRNVGMVIQAYLRRSLEDARALLPLAPDIRICKGIYREPESIAYQHREEVRRSFLDILRVLLGGGARVAIATHDPFLIDQSLQLARELDAGPDRYEFQMLLGVGQELWPRILSKGLRLRLYVPFGGNWHAYSLRRLRENPRIAGYIFRDLIKFPKPPA